MDHPIISTEILNDGIQVCVRAPEAGGEIQVSIRRLGDGRLIVEADDLSEDGLLPFTLDESNKTAVIETKHYKV